MKALLLLTSLLLLVGGAMAEEGRHTNVITPEAVKWVENPAFPKGIQIATLIGDPTKSGETVVQRIKFPPNLVFDSGRPTLKTGRSRRVFLPATGGGNAP